MRLPDLGERLAQGLMRDGWEVKVTTVARSYWSYECNLCWFDTNNYEIASNNSVLYKLSKLTVILSKSRKVHNNPHEQSLTRDIHDLSVLIFENYTQEIIPYSNFMEWKCFVLQLLDIPN